MSVTTTRPTEAIALREDDLNHPAVQAFWLLRVGFTVAPILFGLDKFLDWLVQWEVHLAPEINDPGTPATSWPRCWAASVCHR